MFYGVDIFGTFWNLCKRFLPVAIPVACGIVMATFFFVATCSLEDEDTQNAPVYDATCTDVAHQALERCVEGPRRPCGGVYGPVYTACRDEVLAGRHVHLKGHRFVPAPDLCTPSLCDCTHAVGMAVAATVERCSQVFDCKNEELHPDRCSDDCKYHALEHVLGPRDTDPEWGPYATELTADHEDDAP
jgi:hypothetical protein